MLRIADLENEQALAHLELKNAREIFESLQWSYLPSRGTEAMCPRCMRTEQQGHTPTCRIGLFLKRTELDGRPKKG